MRVLVTGGCGFIGSHIVKFHLSLGHQVYVVDNLGSGSLENLAEVKDNPNLKFENADILIWDNIEKAVAWADRIYHMAAMVGVYRVLAEPVKVLATNIPGTERLLRAVVAVNGKPQIVLASSSEVYGPSTKSMFAETDDLIIESAAQNRWNYAISKLTNEAFGLSYARKYGLHIVIVRFFNTIGPNQTGRYGMVVPRFIEQALKNEPITVYGDGNQTRCFCDVRDTVSILNALASNPKAAAEIINVGLDHEVTINELAEIIRKQANSTSVINHIPYNEAYGQEYFDILKRKPNLEKLRSFVNHHYQWNLESTIDNLIAIKTNTECAVTN